MSPLPKIDEKVTSYPPHTVSNDAEDAHDIAEASDDEETVYPEGGLRAWLVVFGSFCGMYVSIELVRTRQVITMAKASLLRLHEQHQHLQHLPLHPPTRPLQRELHRLDLQRIHLPDLPVRYFHRSSLRCQRAAGAGVCGECVDDGEYYADGGLHRWVSSNLPFHFEAVPFANCAYKNSGIFSSSLVF